MKKLRPRHKANVIFSLLFIITATLFSCSKEISEQVPPSGRVNSVQFAADEVSVAENETHKAIILKLSTPTAKAETISLTITSASAEYGKDYTTEPAAQNGRVTLTVESGKSESSLLIKPINNNVVNSARKLHLQIATEGSTVKPEGKTAMKISLTDDDVTHAAVSFATTSAAIPESHTTGHVIELSISPAAALAGSVDLNLTTTNATYGQHFTTEPAAVNGRLQLPVTQGANTVSFRIKPINDAIVNDPRLVRLSVGQLSAGLQAGQQTNFLLTINNDDAPQANIANIASIRNSFTGADTYIWGGAVISGIVTSVNDNIAPNVVYIEDATGGIALRFTTNHNLQPGQVVSIDIDGSILTRSTEYGIEVRNLPLSSSNHLGWDLKVLPSYTLQSLYEAQGNLEGRAVTLTNVRFADANGTATMQGNRAIADGVRTATVRTESFASFANRIIPGGAVSIMGILVRQNGSYIIRPLTTGSIY